MLITFFLRVVFVLSTIVIVTDCCSSRILLPKNHTLYAGDREKHPEHFIRKSKGDRHENNPATYNHTKSPEFIKKNVDDGVLNFTEKSLLDPGAVEIKTFAHPDEFITNPTIRAEQAGNPKYHVIDIYYTIMRDVLSFECKGQFLTAFCLNKGRCFRYPIGNTSFYSCECADGYVGERCESKSINGVFLSKTTTSLPDSAPPTRILSARVVFSYPMLIAISSIYLLIAAMVLFRCPQKQCPNHHQHICTQLSILKICE